MTSVTPVPAAVDKAESDRGAARGRGFSTLSVAVDGVLGSSGIVAPCHAGVVSPISPIAVGGMRERERGGEKEGDITFNAYGDGHETTRKTAGLLS